MWFTIQIKVVSNLLDFCILKFTDLQPYIFFWQLPFKEWPRFPDVGVAHASPGGFRDVLLLKKLLDGLSHDSHCIIDVGWLILAVDELEADQTWDRAQNKQAWLIWANYKLSGSFCNTQSGSELIGLPV